jgi:hypothetical protein
MTTGRTPIITSMADLRDVLHAEITAPAGTATVVCRPASQAIGVVLRHGCHAAAVEPDTVAQANHGRQSW